jgi:hypothetical protein
MPKIKDGSIIRVHGVVMLAGLDDGKLYRVGVVGDGTYRITTRRGRFVCRHDCAAVDMSLQPADLNRIEVVK